ncbi:MAG: hypothetical protein ABH843_00085 [Candidatus Omnitrophota bacterium]
MEPSETLEQLKQELKPILAELNAEIVEFNLYRVSKKIILRLLVDKEGGIKMDECALINKRLGNIIEEKSIIYENYLLEVNSPGLDRSLKKRRDFERVKPEDEVDFWFKEPLEGESYLSGRIKTAEDDKVVIVDKDGKDIYIPYDIITKAKVKL